MIILHQKLETVRLLGEIVVTCQTSTIFNLDLITIYNIA